MTTIVLDGLNEEDFRRSIENRLREGRPVAAIERLRRLLAPYASPGGILPERFLTIEAADLVLSGWEALGEAVSRQDKPGRPVTAISIAFGWPGDDAPAPDPAGCLHPHVETSFYTDNAYPFSASGREDLLDGYSYYGCTWSGDCEATETVLSLEGVDDLHGALARLEADLLTMEEPDEDGIRAGSLGACLLSVLLVQAVAEQINRAGLPRPLCVMAGSSGVYPYFDAPVAGMPEEARKAAEAAEIEEEEEAYVEPGHAAPAPRYSSLLMTGIPRARKRAVLVLDESQDELDSRIAKLRNLNHEEGGPEEGGEAQGEANPEGPSPEDIDPFALPPMAGPLLAQKPSKQARDLNEMFGLTALAPSPAQSPDIAAPTQPPHQLAEPAEPAPPPPGEPPVPTVMAEAIEPAPSPPGEPPVQALFAEPVEPTLPPAPPQTEAPVEPGFTLLESDIEKRLRDLIAASNPTIAEAQWPAPPVAGGQSAEFRPGTPDPVGGSRAVPMPESRRSKAIVRQALPSEPSLGARLWGKASALLARFTFWR